MIQTLKIYLIIIEPATTLTVFKVSTKGFYLRCVDLEIIRDFCHMYCYCLKYNVSDFNRKPII